MNVLLYAFRADSPRHAEYREWLRGTLTSPDVYGVSPQVLASVIRISTHPGIFKESSPLEQALRFCRDLLTPANASVVHPGERHWGIFCELSEKSSAGGNLVQDAWFAALAIEHGCEWISTDADYDRFPGLRWRRPFE